MSRQSAHCQDALRWLKDRGWNLAPLTGQDRAALESIAHCWRLWCVSDDAGRRAAIDAVASLLDGCQEVVWPMARELIAQAGDWSHRDVVWPKVVQQFEERRARIGICVETPRVHRLAHCHEGHPLVEGERRPLSLVRDAGYTR